MSKYMKQKLVGALLCLSVGIFLLLYVVLDTQKEEIHSYLLGFVLGIVSVAVYFLILVFSSFKSEKIKLHMELKETDERYRYIYHMAMALTFRLSISIEAVASIVCAFLNRMALAQELGFLVGMQLILYLIFYFIIKVKN